MDSGKFMNLNKETNTFTRIRFSLSAKICFCEHLNCSDIFIWINLLFILFYIRYNRNFF